MEGCIACTWIDKRNHYIDVIALRGEKKNPLEITMKIPFKKGFLSNVAKMSLTLFSFHLPKKEERWEIYLTDDRGRGGSTTLLCRESQGLRHE